MTEATLRSFLARPATGVVALAVGGVLFTLGFACALPLAAFAAIAALSFDRRDARVAIGAVWLANQVLGFAFMHYPMDAETLVWGGALGIIALLSCEAARLAARPRSGALAPCIAFLAAFVAYEGSLLVIDLVTNQPADVYAPTTVGRIFLINACAFGGLLALSAILADRAKRQRSATLAPRPV